MNGKSLIEAQASVGLVLVDMVMMIGLSSEEQLAVLGEDLHKEFIKAVRRNNGNGEIARAGLGPGELCWLEPTERNDLVVGVSSTSILNWALGRRFSPVDPHLDRVMIPCPESGHVAGLVEVIDIVSIRNAQSA